MFYQMVASLSHGRTEFESSTYIFWGDERDAAMGGGARSALFCMLVNEPKRWVRAVHGRIARLKPLSNKYATNFVQEIHAF